LSLTLVGLGLAACGSETKTPEGPAGPFPESWDEALTMDVFDGLANQMGEQPGWFGAMVSKDFNLTLNVIAPNVAGGGDTLYNTRVAAGELGDVVVTDLGQKLDELVDGGLLLDLSPYYENMTATSRFDSAVQTVNEGKDGIYAIPTQISSLKPTEPSEG